MPKNLPSDSPWARIFSRRNRSSDDSLDTTKENTDRSVLSPEENRAAEGALRNASWGTVFYLITTDILGPYSSPWAFAQVGYGPGAACFVVFGIMAAYGGLLLWWMFIKLDSDRLPLRTYGDLAHRIYGPYARHLCSVLQTIQLVINVGLIVLSNGQGLSQMVKFRLCFSVCNVLWALAGMVVGQVRTLRRFGIIANASIWLNITTMIIVMASVPYIAPNYTATALTPAPIQRLAINLQPFQQQLNGIMQMVFSYGGAMIFIEFMAEMRRPMDFWKAMALSQLFICVVYMFFGLFVYSYQGQFVVNPAPQTISVYSIQTIANAFYLTASLIAAAMYGNIAVKVIHQTVFVPLFGLPSVNSQKGKAVFAGSVVVYWAIAFVIGSAIPQFSNITALVAAICIFQFTYTFPPLLLLGFLVQTDAMDGEDAGQTKPEAVRRDTWRSLARWRRGRNKSRLAFHVWNFLLTLACLSCASLSGYSAVYTIISSFQTSGSATSFGCKSPVDN
ncbi:hypothetical protein CONPUDRAFT_67730 [Coniophora puteana RWD-64-598 SS2]|uniref:Amino acid transporter transmembrane domain-containing protein n=1 Tax=Coniophora puteana (strain RWD-64-598) TaxID=741705 RepID=R7SDI4_CONPW|nr:uncharacterized protein CONPUDRAFT_67730 [Coniophora puteana RWD-64-598 SS2]EIW74201.1 hypothetical protein CONPUDRAFT_67730 [Coniophora puteana RWD-64-598 SS2]